MSCALYIVLQVSALGLEHVPQLVVEACYVMRTVHCAASYSFGTGTCHSACGWSSYVTHTVHCAASYIFVTGTCPTSCG